MSADAAREAPGRGRALAAILSLGFLAALVVAWRQGAVSSLWVLLYAAMSAIAFLVLAFDKRRARRGGKRISESTLHGLELFGGWPGSLLAQRLLAHKTRKVPYQVLFWGIVVLHLGAWGLHAFG